MLKNTRIKFTLILIAVTFFAYFSSLSNPFMWDDQQFITFNVDVQDFNIMKLFIEDTTAGAGGLKSNYYRPLTSVSFAIDTSIWHNNPFGFHLVNLALHMGTGILLFWLLSSLGVSDMPAFFISLFFLIFPSQTEAVSYINSRGDSLFSFFLLGSLHAFLWALKKRKNQFFILATILFLFSILSKETALFALPFFGVVWWLYIYQQQKVQEWKKMAPWPFFAGISIIAGTYFLLRMTVLNFSNTLNYFTVQNVYTQHMYVRLFTFCKILFVYVGILLWPYPLHMERGVRIITSFSWWVPAALALVGGLLALAIYLYRKHNPWVLFGFLWSAIFLIPVSGFIPINGLLYEHWLYMPMVGFFLMLYGGIQFVVLRSRLEERSRDKIKRFLIYFAVVLASLYIVLTIRQNNIWSNAVTFYRYTLQFAPNSPRLHDNLGVSLQAVGDMPEAIAEFKKAIVLVPNDPYSYSNLGNAYMYTKQYDLAEQNFLHSIKLAPQVFVSRANLVKLYLIRKQYDKARIVSGNNPVVEMVIKQQEQLDQEASVSAGR